MYDFIIIGGGIIGLSTGMSICKRFPNAKLAIIEKEDCIANHQTGNNSGVIHSGIYYKPGSFKARFAREGNKSMTDFCEEYNIDHDKCGKVIVATNEEELKQLENLHERGKQNNLDVEKIDSQKLKEIEPHVNGVGAIRVPQAGMVDYKQVSEKFAEIIKQNDGEIFLNTEVNKIQENSNDVYIETNRGQFTTNIMINCTGLQSDRIANLTGYKPDMKILPFRGEYFKLKKEKRYLVKNLVYPVPNPKFPFLGVHFTRMIDGEVEAGPNAVLSFKREGYKKTDLNVKDFLDSVTYPGLWKLGRKFMKEGIDEYVRSFSKKQFTKSLQKLVPEIQEDDLISAPAGVRAQAIKNDGTMVDDFHIIMGKRSVHICNAPSPAATASIEIGNEIVNRLSNEFNDKESAEK